MKDIFFLLLFWGVTAQNCPENLTIDISDGSFNNETKSRTYKNVTYAPGQYFQLGDHFKGCVCKVQTCVNFCCPPGEAMLDGFNCADYKWEPKIDLYNEAILLQKNANFHAINVKLKPICLSLDLDPDNFKEDTFYIQQDGKLYIPFSNIKTNFENYCISLFSNESEQEIRTCVESDDSYFFVAVMIISILCLLLPLIAYILLLDKRNIHSKCQIAYVVSLLCAYFVMVYLQLVEQSNTNICITLALFYMYSFMSSLFWMNITCIDIFLTFSGKRGFGLHLQSNQMKRFAAYCCYAFGAPLIIVIITIANNSDIHKDKWFYPNIGETQCWFTDSYAVVIHFYGPMGALIFANMVLFILTTLEIRKIRKDTAMLRQAENNKHHENNKQMYNLYIKLLITMGITWTWEFITVLVEWLLEDEQIRGMWYFTNLFNALYGVFIFYQIVCNKRTWIVLKIRYYNFIGQHLKANALATKVP